MSRVTLTRAGKPERGADGTVPGHADDRSDPGSEFTSLYRPDSSQPNAPVLTATHGPERAPVGSLPADYPPPAKQGASAISRACDAPGAAPSRARSLKEAVSCETALASAAIRSGPIARSSRTG
jgi:hypothetical protein